MKRYVHKIQSESRNRSDYMETSSSGMAVAVPGAPAIISVYDGYEKDRFMNYNEAVRRVSKADVAGKKDAYKNED